MNTLVLVAGGLVETLQATPLLRTLGHSDALGQVVLAAPPVALQLGDALADAHEVVALEALSPHSSSAAVMPAYLALRARRLDAALICSARGRDRLLVYATGVARRAAVSGGGLDLLLTDRVSSHDGENQALAWLRLAGRAAAAVSPRPSFDPGDWARERAATLLVGGGLEDGRLLVAVAPGAGFGEPIDGLHGSLLLWDAERYAHLCNQLSRRHGAGVVLLGSHEDRFAADRLLMDLEAPVLDLCGQLELREVGAVLGRCDLLVAGDSPLLHLASAVGTPAVGLFGPTDGRRRGPYGAEHRVVQGVSRSGGPGAAMDRIRVDDVLAGIESSL